MAILRSIFYILHSRAGQAVLVLTLVIGGIITTVALSLGILAASFINSAYGFSISERAEAVASSGASDALIRLLRNKDYPSGTYEIGVGNASATVTIAQNSPVAGEVTIISTATILMRQRTTTIITTRSSTSSLITVISKIQS